MMLECALISYLTLTIGFASLSPIFVVIVDYVRGLYIKGLLYLPKGISKTKFETNNINMIFNVPYNNCDIVLKEFLHKVKSDRLWTRTFRNGQFPRPVPSGGIKITISAEGPV